MNKEEPQLTYQFVPRTGTVRPGKRSETLVLPMLTEHRHRLRCDPGLEFEATCGTSPGPISERGGLVARAGWILVQVMLLAMHRGEAVAQCTQTWQPLGTPPGVGGHIVDGADWGVFASTLWDPDGVGPLPAQLVVGGTFTTAGGSPANRIARWDGTAWHPLGSGMDGAVFSLAALPNGELVAGGRFTHAGGVAANHIARWNGFSWSPLGAGLGGLDNSVNCLAALPTGQLVAGGGFAVEYPNQLALIMLWSGGAWSPLAMTPDLGGPVYSLATRPNGELVVGGHLGPENGQSSWSVGTWNGHGWTPLGDVDPETGEIGPYHEAFSVTTLPNGDIIAFGLERVTLDGGYSASRWNGSTWQRLGEKMLTWSTGAQPRYPMAVLPDGDLMVSNIFRVEGSNPMETGLFRWNGTTWSNVVPFLYADQVYTITRTPVGDLVAGGAFWSAIVGSETIVVNDVARFTFDGTALSINAQPQPLSVCRAGTASFSVSASSPSALSYRWRKDSNPISLASNPTAATATLTLTNVQSGSAGQYDCVVANACGSSLTQQAALTVLTPPAITTQPTPAIACVGGSATFSVVASGSAPLTYRWRKGGVPISVATNPSAATPTLGLANVQANDAGSFSCLVTNACGSALSTAQPLTVRSPVSITQQPVDAFTCPASAATFSVGVMGTGPVAFVWRKDGAPISVSSNASAATSTLMLAALGVHDSGTYDCVVSNACNAVTSRAAELVVCPADFNCDGSADFFDYDDFVSCFEGVACPPDHNADFDGDGAVDLFDYDGFVLAFETPC